MSSAGRYFGLSLHLNVQVDDYLTAHSSGATVVIHDQDEPINLALRGVATAPGAETYIAVTKTKVSVACR